MLLDELEVKLADCKIKLQKQEDEMNLLSRQIEDIKSKKWIRENNVTINDIQFSCPMFSEARAFEDSNDFAAWLTETNCQMKWVEWEGSIYETKAFVNGFGSSTPGRMRDFWNLGLRTKHTPR